ncbi:HugZ family protein [Dankookia sp. GCM10030260]|uniref:HugZ family pyridoxamine 5'-phosphate oxidase n=1 Tax=Dankookia sp. GCM10030260 TaxID=3273390 RepID=UPI00361A72E5
MVTDNPAFEARILVRGAASATLATQAAGQPFASLVTPAAAPDLTILLLLSSLSEHTRQLRAEPRCALLFQGTAAEANPQTAPRVTLTGLAAPVPEAEVPALKARFLAKHPYAALYADFGDFALWRITPAAAQLVGGFARALRLRGTDLLPDPAAVAALAPAAAGILDHVNADHAESVAAIATRRLGGPPGAWRMVALDPDGADLALEERVLRLNFNAPAADPAGVRAELIRASREAGAGLA